MGSSRCDTCAYNVYDEEEEVYYCETNMDEDDVVRMIGGNYKSCPYSHSGKAFSLLG